MEVCEAILLHCTLIIQLPISISKYLFNTMYLQVYWVLYRMYWRLEVVNFIWASVLSDEEGSFKWHQRNQKQTQSNTKLATKISLLHIYFSKRCAFSWNQRSFLIWASCYSSLLPHGVLLQNVCSCCNAFSVMPYFTTHLNLYL